MSRRRVEVMIAAMTLAIVLAIQGPLFVRSPLGPDPVMYDLQAQVVQDGGVLYRDILEPNLPGAVWIHLTVRSLGGWSSETLRLFDLGWFLTAAWLAATLAGIRATGKLLVLAIAFSAYSTQSEWCHCQRDVWTLPFVLGAIAIRQRRTVGAQPSGCSIRTSPTALAAASAEGLLWGAAVWLKPHVIVPALAVALVDILSHLAGEGGASAPCAMDLRPTDARGPWRTLITREALVLLGGSIAGALGILWLIMHDAWRPLWSMLTEWNREYVTAAADRWSWGRWWSVQERLMPWSLLHVVAVTFAMKSVLLCFRGACSQWRGCVGSHRGLTPPTRRADLDGASMRGGLAGSRPTLLAALYLGWLIQAFWLQHLFDYVHVPALLLAATVVLAAVQDQVSIEWSPRRVSFAATLAIGISLVMRSGQLELWPQCVGESGGSSLRAALGRLPLPSWPHLERVERFLRERNVRDGELTCHHTHTVHLYPALDVKPSTRYVFTETHLRLFPSRANEIGDALARSNQRFVVTSLLEAGVDPELALDDSEPENWRQLCSLRALSSFPFDQPVVFRSGPYLVHEVAGPLGPMETRFFPLAAKSAGL
jgi:hypothetical protein